MKIVLVTGNAGKLKEWERLMPKRFGLEAHDVDLVEIQSLDHREIIEDKVRRAYAKLKQPVIVEDVSASLSCLNGLPGPFVKYFEIKLGEGALYKLALPYDDKNALIRCDVAFFDGQKLLFSYGEIKGKVVSLRGDHGFGFDKVFMPDSGSQTFGEMGIEEKDHISHRSQAVKSLVQQLSPAV
jgi:inosine triphosphate pyrophosphatase